jgi:hypothetical protein
MWWPIEGGFRQGLGPQGSEEALWGRRDFPESGKRANSDKERRAFLVGEWREAKDQGTSGYH